MWRLFIQHGTFCKTVHEGTKAIKINKLQQLTYRFGSIRMSDDESFNEFYAKLNDIINSIFSLGEVYDQQIGRAHV